MTEYQAAILPLYADGLSHKRIARKVGGTPDGVRRVLRNLRDQGRLPVRQRIEWPVPQV